MSEQQSEQTTSGRLVDGMAQGGYTYLTRCVAIVTLLHERGIIDELIQSGRISQDEVDLRVEMLEQNFPGFQNLKQQTTENQTTEKGE